jgi:hypothetical protein
MADGLDHLERRLQRLERLIYKIAEHCGCLADERSEVGPQDGYTRLFRKEVAALDRRVSQLEIKQVRVDARVARYMRQRIARDNILARSADAMTDGIEAFEERLNNVELAAFPDAADAVSQIIGDLPRAGDARSEALDRRIPKSRPKA